MKFIHYKFNLYCIANFEEPTMVCLFIDRKVYHQAKAHEDDAEIRQPYEPIWSHNGKEPVHVFEPLK